MFDALVNVLTLAAIMGIGGMVFTAVGMFIVGLLGLHDE